MNASFAKISHNLIVMTPCEFIEILEANYHVMLMSCLQVRENDTKKVTMKVKRIVNVDVVYIVHNVKVFGECQRHNI